MTPRHGGLFYDRNGRWFDGTGSPSALRHLGIRDGHVVTITPHDLDETGCPQVIDATGKWVLPSMLDIHTHYDVEVLNGPSLSESLRHGVTSVMLGSCSLSTIHVDGVNAGDLFGRVEAIPREHVISAVDQHKTWTNCEEYIQALEARPLGPNVAAFIGHSDMRAATMGLDRATQKKQRPTKSEQAHMKQRLAETLKAGFVGMSSQQLLFDKLDGDVCRSRTLPSTYAKPRELRRLKSTLRRAGRILQSGPDIGNPFNLGSQVAQSLGFFRNPLKTSLLSAADVESNPYAIKMMGPVARLINRLGGNFRWQHLPVPFEVYADGIDLVIFEEFGAGAAALHLRDEVERNEMLRDEAYRRQFRKQYESKFGVRVWHRNFFDADIVACPDATVIGKSFGQVGEDRGGLHPVDAFLDLVLEHGRALRWRTTISNHRPDVLKKLARAPGTQMGSSSPTHTDRSSGRSPDSSVAPNGAGRRGRRLHRLRRVPARSPRRNSSSRRAPRPLRKRPRRADRVSRPACPRFAPPGRGELSCPSPRASAASSREAAPRFASDLPGHGWRPRD